MTRVRTAFTLVELLVVILIIGMLMALLTTAVMQARQTARDAAVTLELNNIGLALDKFREAKSSGNVYPPDFAQAGLPAYQNTILLPYVRQAFPRYASAGTWANFVNNVQAVAGRNINNLQPPEAIVFWLGGIPRLGTVELAGFSASQIDPFADISVQAQRETRYYDFAASRLADRDGDGWPEYYPAGSNPASGSVPPIVYFAARLSFPLWDTSGQNLHRYWGQYSPIGMPNAGVAVPYALDANNNGAWDATDSWIEHERFQLIAAGIDNTYGTGAVTTRAIPRPLSLGDRDNLTSFRKGPLAD